MCVLVGMAVFNGYLHLGVLLQHVMWTRVVIRGQEHLLCTWSHGMPTSLIFWTCARTQARCVFVAACKLYLFFVSKLVSPLCFLVIYFSKNQ